MQLWSLILLPALQVVLVMAELKITPNRSPHAQDINQQVLFTCQAPDLSADEANLQWWKNGAPIATSHRVKTEDLGDLLSLNIRPAQQDDAGTYTCKGSVDGQEVVADITLEFYTGIEVTSPKVQYPVQATDAKIMCQLATSNSQITVLWYRQTPGSQDETRIQNNDRYRINPDHLQIRNIQQEDKGVYICKPNIFALGLSVDHVINVIVTVIPVFSMPIAISPTTPKEGDHMMMTCRADGIPEPKYTFNKKDPSGVWVPVLEDSHGEYRIQNVTRTDDGDYQCVAVNKGGQAVSNTVLNVGIPPKIEAQSQPKEDQENNRMAMDCVAVGKPAPSLSWRRKDNDYEYSASTNSDEGVYVDESASEQELDEQTKLFRKMLTLVIPRLQASNAGKYVCEATNSAGRSSADFVINVLYKPNFDDQQITDFWGWKGGSTNLTCIANGNPSPIILWKKGDQDVTNSQGNVIRDGSPMQGSQTKIISYLIPSVTDQSLSSVFGDYKCLAKNRLGTNEQTLTFKEASVPEPPTINLISKKPTELVLGLEPPKNNGGQEVKRFLVRWSKSLLPSDQGDSMSVDRNVREASTQVLIKSLEPSTQYSIKAFAISAVGESGFASVVDSTSDVSKPDPVTVTSGRSGASANSYTLEWSVPMTGGAEITNYVIEYVDVTDVDTSKETWQVVRIGLLSQTVQVQGQSTTSKTLTDLKRDSYYRVSIKAVNRIGASESTEFIFKTGKGTSAGTDDAACVGHSLVGLLASSLLALAWSR